MHTHIRLTLGLLSVGAVGAAVLSVRSNAPTAMVSSTNVSAPADVDALTWKAYILSAHEQYDTGTIGSSDSITAVVTGIGNRDNARNEAKEMTVSIALPKGLYLDHNPDTYYVEKGVPPWNYTVGDHTCTVAYNGQSIVTCPLAAFQSSDWTGYDNTAPIGSASWKQDAVRFTLLLNPRITAEDCGKATTVGIVLRAKNGVTKAERSLPFTMQCVTCADFCGGFGFDLCTEQAAPGCAWQAGGWFTTAHCYKKPECGSSSSSSSSASSKAVVTSSESSSSSSSSSSTGKRFCCAPSSLGSQYSCEEREPYSWYNPVGWFTSICFDAKEGTESGGYDTENGCAAACSPMRYCCAKAPGLDSQVSCSLAQPNAQGKCATFMPGTEGKGYLPTADGKAACESACVESACCSADGSGGCEVRHPGGCFDGETEHAKQQCSVRCAARGRIAL